MIDWMLLKELFYYIYPNLILIISLLNIEFIINIHN